MRLRVEGRAKARPYTSSEKPRASKARATGRAHTRRGRPEHSQEWLCYWQAEDALEAEGTR
jgi:hypothetical protein